jgi:hypothetical protein
MAENNRPSAEEWEKILETPARFRGRPTVKMEIPTTKVISSTTSNATPISTPRPIINLKGNISE